MLGTYGSALLVVLFALAIGRALCRLTGAVAADWLAAPVGFAVLMMLCQVTIMLPGRGWTAVAAVLLAAAGGAAAWLRWPMPRARRFEALVVGGGCLFFVSIPFLASGRMGILGVSLLNDTHWHLILAESLLRPAIHTYGYGSGYPLGPHAVAATFARLLGTDVGKGLTGVLMAVPILTALTGLGFLRGRRGGVARLAATLGGVAYLAAAWYAQSAFKEPILSLLMLGLVLNLQAARRSGISRLAPALITALLVAGVVYDYSYPGLVWPAALLLAWTALGWGARAAGRVRRSRTTSDARALALGGLLLILLLVPDLGRIHAFWLSNGGLAVGTVGGVTRSSLSDLVGPLSSFEALSLWLSGDFRFAAPDALEAGLLAGLGSVLLVNGVLASLQRRQLAWPAAVLSMGAIYLYAKYAQSPYVAAKAMVVAAPIVMLGMADGLLYRLDRLSLFSGGMLALYAACVTFFVFAFQSSWLVLGDAFVGPQNHVEELRALRPLLHGRPTLALLDDDYVQWELLIPTVSSPLLSSPVPAPVRRAKPWSPGQPLDFDSVDAATLDRFDFVITTRTPFQSQPPPNFRLIGHSPSYDVWQRVGPTPPHRVLPESGQPGAVLDCRRPGERRIAAERGYAEVRPAPVVTKLGRLVDGATEQVTLRLPPGLWNLSAAFTSDQPLLVTAPGLRVRLPPNLDRRGGMWSIGDVVSVGAPLTVRFRVGDPGLIRSASQHFEPEYLVADRPVADTKLPLNRACGRYVDWYVVG